MPPDGVMDSGTKKVMDLHEPGGGWLVHDEGYRTVVHEAEGWLPECLPGKLPRMVSELFMEF